MVNLTVFFRNHFDNKRLSDIKLRKFTDIHLQRLITNNPGNIYDQLIFDTTTVYSNYFGAIGNEAFIKARKEGATLALAQFIEKFKKDVSRKEGTVRSIYGTDSQEYQEFFPQGLSIYLKADLGNIHTLTQLMKDTAAAHAVDVGADFVTLFADHHANIKAKREAQLQLMGAVASKRDETEVKRSAIEVQLMKNVLTIALNNIDNLSAVNTYFDQSVLQRGYPSRETYEEIVEANSTVNLLQFTFAETDEIYAENTGTVDWKIGLELQAPNPVSGGIIVPHGQVMTIKASDLGDVTKNFFLNITNENNTEGSYIVRL